MGRWVTVLVGEGQTGRQADKVEGVGEGESVCGEGRVGVRWMADAL